MAYIILINKLHDYEQSNKTKLINKSSPNSLPKYLFVSLFFILAHRHRHRHLSYFLKFYFK